MLQAAALDALLEGGRAAIEASSKIYGVVPAIVKAVHDPKQKRHMMGMVQVFFPWLQPQGAEKPIEPWARVVSRTAGANSGLFTMPKVGDEVCVAFEHGNIHFPYVLGAVHNGVDTIPTPTTPADGADFTCHHGGPTLSTPDLTPDSVAGDAGNNKVYFWRSRTGNLIAMDDNKGTVRICDRAGNSAVQITKDQVMCLQRTGKLSVIAAKTIEIDCKDLEIHAKNNVFMQAGNQISINAKQHITMEAVSAYEITAGANINMQSQSNEAHFYAKSDFSMTCGAKFSFKCGSGPTTVSGVGGVSIIAGPAVNVKSAAKVKINGAAGVNFMAGGEMTVKAGGNVSLKGAVINLN